MDDILVKEIITSIVIVIIGIFVYYLIKEISSKLLKVNKKIIKNSDRLNTPEKEKNASARVQTTLKLISNISKYIIICICAISILNAFGFDTKTLIASLGIIGVLTGLALQDFLKDVIAGFSIISENQYNVGDWVTIGTFRGEVLEIGIKTTKIKSYQGDVKIISNRNITEVVNHSIQPDRTIIDISVSYDSDLEKVESVLKEVCEKINKEINYLVDDMQILGIEKLDDSAVVYRLIADVESIRNFEFNRVALKAVKEAFEKNKIEIPFPQMVIHNG